MNVGDAYRKSDMATAQGQDLGAGIPQPGGPMGMGGRGGPRRYPQRTRVASLPPIGLRLTESEYSRRRIARVL
jgi:hypothetical protein